MEQYKYTIVPRKILPQAIIDELILEGLIKNDNILVEMQNDMYGLQIAHDKLINHLNKDKYMPTGLTPGIFTHTQAITCCLVVDNFGIKYENKLDIYNLLRHLDKEYTTTVNNEGHNFCRVHLNRDYSKRTVELILPDYILKELIQLKHPPPTKT